MRSKQLLKESYIPFVVVVIFVVVAVSFIE